MTCLTYNQALRIQVFGEKLNRSENLSSTDCSQMY
jgi:hypothetical protein